MSVNKTEEKKEIIKNFQRHDNDAGSSEVQIAVLTNKINYLVEHLKEHKKDHHTRRGLLTLVSRRRKLMKFLKRKNVDTFLSVAEKLKLRVKNY